MNFSERYGYKKVREIVQVDSMEQSLRNGLWSLLKINVWDNVKIDLGMTPGYFLSSRINSDIQSLCIRLWHHYFKRPLDELNDDWEEVLPGLRNYFFKCNWHEVYDFIEFVANNYEKINFRDKFISSCNILLTREVSAYRFVGGLITRITEQEQLDEVELALESPSDPIRTHLRRALELLSHKESPDYRNSIKESISAVESLVGKTTGVDKGTLGQLIKKLEDEIGLHRAISTAFRNLYGYTSDQKGIRHALMESADVQFEDAKFFLVVCSAFVNYVETKTASPG